MPRLRGAALILPSMLCALFTLVCVALPSGNRPAGGPGNSYHLYTGALHVDEAGVARAPSRYRWSVETSWRGVDPQGRVLPDSRLLLRLYDPDRNFTALIAQLDMEIDATLHHELGHLIDQKRKNPDFQHRPQLYDASAIRNGRLIGVDENGTAIIELESSPAPKKASPDQAS